MLYGGPLGTYLSGIYQPVKSLGNSSGSSASSKPSHRSSLRSSATPSSTSALYYTPQPRRRTDTSDHQSRYSSIVPSSSTYGDSSTSNRTRPRSYYNSSPAVTKQPALLVQHSPTSSSPALPSSSYSSSRVPSSTSLRSNVSPSTFRPSSKYNKENNRYTGLSPGSGLSSGLNTFGGSMTELDYKRMYEEECDKTSQLKTEITDSEKELLKAKGLIENKRRYSDDSNKLKEINLANEMDVKELELLRSEGDKLKAENRALARVVARLSREK